MNGEKTTSIMIVGVGGQGTLLASRLIGYVLVNKGYDVKLSEVHGMSQRGGSVVTYVKYGSCVYSPIVDAGEADYILSFEPLEAARYLSRLKAGGCIITNTRKSNPMPVVTGQMAYPDNVCEKLESKAKLLAVDAASLAARAGSEKAVNTVLLGALSRFMPEIEDSLWMEAIEQTVKPNFVALNKEAFRLGAAL